MPLFGLSLSDKPRTSGGGTELLVAEKVHGKTPIPNTGPFSELAADVGAQRLCMRYKKIISKHVTLRSS